MITKRELLMRLVVLEKLSACVPTHTHPSGDIKHLSSTPSEHYGPYGNMYPHYPELGNMREILDAILNHCGIELKVVPPKDKELKIVKKESK